MNKGQRLLADWADAYAQWLAEPSYRTAMIAGLYWDILAEFAEQS